jgi:hypothetical protein
MLTELDTMQPSTVFIPNDFAKSMQRFASWMPPLPAVSLWP